MIDTFAIAKTAIETDLEGSVAVLFDIVSETPNASDGRFRTAWVNDVPFVFMRPDRVSPFLFFDRSSIWFFTNDEFFDSPEMLRPFLRGCLEATRRVWAGYKKGGLDFDRDNLFFRRPWPGHGAFAHQTIVLAAAENPAEEDLRARTLIVAAVGRREEGLPFDSAVDVDMDAYNAFLTALSRVDLAQQTPPKLKDHTVTTLDRTLERPISPGGLSFDQWMHRLQGEQQRFVVTDVAGPQRIDGPAGSGKTLALVLKCLRLLRSAEQGKRSQHAAFVVFSESTRAKVLDSFFVPLDSRGFYLRSMKSDAQSLTITTLLQWSNEEIGGIVPPYSLLTEDASVARRDQRAIVIDVLKKYLSVWKQSLGVGLSPELTAALQELTPILVNMFQHEFGVVIKGMADGERRKYLTLQRPKIALPCVTVDDRRFVYAMFEEYRKELTELGVVDLDDVAISHLKLLQMPLRPRRGFDIVFVDEAHSFNPNEIAVLSLLVRETDAPKLVVSVDLPQGLGDKGYDEGGLEAQMLQDIEGKDVVRFPFPASYRCSQEILTLAALIYAQGANFYKPIRVPSSLLANRPAFEAVIPFARSYPNAGAMMEGVVEEADRMVASLKCKRSDILIVLLYEALFDMIPPALRAVSTGLRRKTDAEQEQAARRAKHFVLGRAEYLHGLEYEGVLLVGASHGEVPRSDPARDRGATAVYEIQRVVNELYLSITRARRQVGVLYEGQLSFLFREALRVGSLRELR